MFSQSAATVRHALSRDLLNPSTSLWVVGSMSRRRFVGSFVVLAGLFIPVLFWYGLADLTVPCGYQFMNIGCELLYSPGRMVRHWRTAVLVGLYLVFYGALFYAAARLSFWGCSLVAGRLRYLAQIAILFAVVSCSFIRAIEYNALNYGGSGTYNFWEACIRYSKTHGKILTGEP